MTDEKEYQEYEPELPDPAGYSKQADDDEGFQPCTGPEYGDGWIRLDISN